MPEGAVSVTPLRLLRTPVPYSGESFLGYLLRLTEENAYDSLRWIPERVGLKVNLAQGRSLETLSTLTKRKISLLREITGLNEAELELLRKTLVPGYLLRWKAPKVCPVCLKEKNWCRKAWDVLPFTVCPLHRVILIDSCPHCHQSLSWRRKKVSVCNCGFDWRRISPPVIEGEGELTAVRMMLSIWRENELGYLPLEDATDSTLTREVSVVICALSDAWLFLRNKARLQTTTENGLCHRAMTSIAFALDDWPASFFRFCDEFDTAALKNLERLWFGYSGGELNKTQGWRLVVAALDVYLEGRQNGDSPTLEKFLRIEEAGRQLGLAVSHVERLVEQGKLRIERMHPVDEVAADLGIGLSQLSDLGQYGWLSPDSGPGIEGLAETKFSRKTLDAFLNRISVLVTPAHDMGDHNIVPLCRVADHLWLHGLSFGRFMQAMDSGFPQPVVEREGLRGRLSRFWFRIDEINRYLDSQLDPDKRPAAVHYAVPPLDKLVAWLDRKQEEVDNRFYRYPGAPLRKIMLDYVRRLQRQKESRYDPTMFHSGG